MTVAMLPRFLLLSSAFFAGPMLTHAAEQPGTDAPAERNYVAYLGLDVRIQNQGKDCAVVSYQEPRLSIQRGTEQVTIPISEAKYALSVEPKLGRSNVDVTNLRASATVDPRNDPVLRGLQQQQTMDFIQTQNQDMAAYNAATSAANAADMARAAQNPYSGISQEQVAAAQRDAASAAQDFSNAYAMPMFQSHLPGQFTTEGNASADAFEVSFSISAREPLRDAFGVVRMVVRFPEDPQHPAAVLKFFSLRNVGPDARKLSILQTGLPPGFTLDSYDIHIYSAGLEVPTNLSANRMDLSADEAHQFLILRHCHLNTGANIPVALIPDLVPPDVRQWLAALHTDATVDLSIDRNGRVTQVNAIQGNAELSAAEVESKLREVRFYPALVKGAPVDSRGTFGLSEFTP